MLRAALLAALVWVAAGCATYTDQMLRANQAALAGDYPSSVAAVDSMLGVSSAEQLPAKWSADTSLWTLERGVLQQAVESYPGSARDLSAAEQNVELLDLSTDPIGVLGGYIYSDSTKPYKAPPSERLSLNAVNLLNYLAQGNLDGAAVEARRFQTMREFLESQRIDDPRVAAFGAYLAGFVFDRKGEPDRALRYYDEALSAGPLPSLAAPVARLARIAPYRGRNLNSFLRVGAGAASTEKSEILVVLSYGRVPVKVPQRIPVGAAVALVGAAATNNADWLARGAGKVVVYPELVPVQNTLGPPSVRVDGREVPLDRLADLDEAIRREYEAMKPKILAAALTRMAARAGVAEGVRAAGNQQSNELGAVLGLLVEGTMVALDRPDSSSSTMLPARLAVARVPISPGSHRVEVNFPGGPPAARAATVNVGAESFAAVVVTEPR